jgi:hypothetical protein
MSDDDAPLFAVDGDVFLPSAHTRSPWSTASLHGGAAGALLTRAIEHHATDQPMRIARMTIDFVRPVPVAPLAIEVRTVRPGRRVSVVAADLIANGDACARLTSLLLHETAIPIPADTPLPADARSEPGPMESGPPSRGWSFEAFHTHGCDVRYARGDWLQAGPAFAWIRLRKPVIDGEAPSPVQRLAAAADFGNGVSAALPFDRWTFINPDLTLHVERPPDGEWIGLDAVTRLSGHGSGSASTTLYDEQGRVGAGFQSLLVAAL